MSRDVLSSEVKRKSQAQLQNQIPKKGQKRNGCLKDKSEKKWRVISINLGFSRWLIARPIESNEVSKLAIVVQMIFLLFFFLLAIVVQMIPLTKTSFMIQYSPFILLLVLCSAFIL